MAFLFRLGLRTQNLQLARLQNYGAINFIRNVKLKPIMAPPIPVEEYEKKNNRLQRPLSPHLSIYKPQITSMLSITERITGVVLGSYAVTFGMIAHLFGRDEIVCAIGDLSENNPLVINLIRAAIAIPFAYHSVAGLRQTYWDLGYGIDDLNAIYTGCYLVIGVFLLLAVALMSIRLHEVEEPPKKK